MHFPATIATSRSTSAATINHHDYYPCPTVDTPAILRAARTPRGSISSKQSVEDILQRILTTRKSWKTLKGQSEAVWPPYLETTMLKALQEYEPEDSRETRILGRYPMRNRFISEYIHRATGKYRSAKQVGSRLQQLRDTAEGRELIDSLTRCYHTRAESGGSNLRISVCQPTPWPASSSPQFSTISCDTGSWDSSSSSSSSTDSPLVSPSDYSPIMSHSSSKQRQPAESRMPVYIDILPEHPRWSSTAYGSSRSSHAPVASSSMSSSHGSSFRPSDAARRMRDIDPTVTFVSPSPVIGKSSYIVLLDGAPVHTEDTKLEYVGPYFSSSQGQSPGDGPVLYNTALVPKYWEILCKAADPTLYTIIQDVYRAPDPTPNQGHSQRPRSVLIFSAIYHFKYPTTSPSASTTSRVRSPLATPRADASMTSALDHQVLQDYLNPIRPMPFQKYSYPTSTPEKMRAASDLEQNVFDEPFMLDVDIEDFRFDDFTVNIQDSPDSTPRSSSTAFFPKDLNTYLM
ncbi:hypothetical protein HYDPIDRAFT_112907 [Hydnomerulius pinastri MD-312]|uniref:TEA domain-containing protein n=1 Tax=Hydnomerulius pinastri MD-312 TaxID=994086 RepID=A0A0C9VD33_9AGAM|nr:hypothetical protein HYDPIDRAFT_112907 [Hydnomerulius pinastri MD-312]